jgi:hypothetical protein
MTKLRRLRQRFDTWRKERLDEKLLALRLRYESDDAYVVEAPKETEVERWSREGREEAQKQLEAEALFGDRRRADQWGLPPIFKMSDVVGIAAPEFDAKSYAEKCVQTYGTFEDQHEALVASLRNNRGQAYPADPVIQTWPKGGATSNTVPFVPVKSTTPCKEKN